MIFKIYFYFIFYLLIEISRKLANYQISNEFSKLKQFNFGGVAK